MRQDKPNSLLYWKPGAAVVAAAAAPAALEAIVSVHTTVVSAFNVTNVSFVGLALLHARGSGVNVTSSTQVQLLDSVIANHGELGVDFTNSSDSAISGCRVEQTGSGGVNLEGGYRPALIPANLTLQNTNVTATSRWERFPPGRGAGVQLHGVGNTVHGNHFASIPHQSIRVYGNDHTIEGNLFTDSLFETADSGVIYSGRDWTILGNVVRGNNITGVHSLYYPRMPWEYKVYPLPDGRWGDYVKWSVYHTSTLPRHTFPTETLLGEAGGVLRPPLVPSNAGTKHMLRPPPL